MSRDLPEGEMIAVANDVLTEFSEDWDAGRCDFEEDIIENLAVACRIL